MAIIKKFRITSFKNQDALIFIKEYISVISKEAYDT